MQVLDCIYVAPSSLGGRGVFTSKFISAGSMIEICPVIVMPDTDRQLIHQTVLHDYYFIWGDNDDHCALPMGYGMIYNHSYAPNAEYIPDFEKETLDFFALTDIRAGEEITVNYNGDPRVQDEVWFDVK